MVMDGGEAMETGLKVVSRKSFVQRFFSADYIDVPANAQILKLLSKQGDRQVLFADNVMKLNRSAKLVRRVLIITEVAMYILDSDFYRMRHRFALQASFYLMDEDDASVALASGISWLTDTYIHVHIYVCITYVWLSIRSEFLAAMAVVVLAGLYLNLTFLGHVDSLACVCCNLLFDSLFAFLKLNCLGERVCRPSRS
jgi:hypothetical protein